MHHRLFYYFWGYLVLEFLRGKNFDRPIISNISSFFQLSLLAKKGLTYFKLNIDKPENNELKYPHIQATNNNVFTKNNNHDKTNSTHHH